MNDCIPVNRNQLWFAVHNLSSRKFFKLAQLVSEYADELEKNGDAKIPTSGDKKIDVYLFGACYRICENHRRHRKNKQ